MKFHTIKTLADSPAYKDAATKIHTLQTDKKHSDT